MQLNHVSAIKMKAEISIFWFRRDLRLDDNTALNAALKSPYPVLPIFIFDDEITDELPQNDARITFIYQTLQNINSELNERHNSSLRCHNGNVTSVWNKLLSEYTIKSVFLNTDYEPYAVDRDQRIKQLLKSKNCSFHSFKDHVHFEAHEVLKNDGKPYTVYTPYKNKWLSQFSVQQPMPIANGKFIAKQFAFPSIESLGFKKSTIKVLPFQLSNLANYDFERNYPSLNSTSKLGPHLRFGTVSIRSIMSTMSGNAVFLSELIWREFFIQILVHFPKVVQNNFKSKYDGIQWRNNTKEFELWKNGNTGYPLVDAGMRELNATGYMHNRVRMITAGFLCKHLLIDWKWGEAYFAEKLLDYELASNNGNWQWSAGTGCDAAPYFRIFNPTAQLKKFDAKLEYINKWIPEFNDLNYPQPIVEHSFARKRALEAYKLGLAKQ